MLRFGTRDGSLCWGHLSEREPVDLVEFQIVFGDIVGCHSGCRLSSIGQGGARRQHPVRLDCLNGQRGAEIVQLMHIFVAVWGREHV